MTITREQVADLRAGDVVEYAGHAMLHGAKLTGPLHESLGDLLIGGYVVRYEDGRGPLRSWGDLTLTVISRTKPPLYVNHPRTEPVPGDVVRDADGDGYDATTWVCFRCGPATSAVEWMLSHGGITCSRSRMPSNLRLLVDGYTGQVVSDTHGTDGQR